MWFSQECWMGWVGWLVFAALRRFKNDKWTLWKKTTWFNDFLYLSVVHTIFTSCSPASSGKLSLQEHLNDLHQQADGGDDAEMKELDNRKSVSCLQRIASFGTSFPFYDAFDMLFVWIMCCIYLVPTTRAILLHILPVYHAYEFLGKFMPIHRYSTSLVFLPVRHCKSCGLKVETAKFKAADLDGDSVLSAHEVASLFYPETWSIVSVFILVMKMTTKTGFFKPVQSHECHVYPRKVASIGAPSITWLDVSFTSNFYIQFLIHVNMSCLVLVWSTCNPRISTNFDSISRICMKLCRSKSSERNLSR